MGEQYTWFCFKRVLPKKDYEFIAEDQERLSFFKDGEPLVTLQKKHRFSSPHRGNNSSATLHDTRRISFPCTAMSGTIAKINPDSVHRF